MKTAVSTPVHAMPPGLSEAEAARLVRERGPLTAPRTSRSYLSILKANLLTPFNAILAFFGVLTLLFADWRDALFLGILVANTAIGAGQEVRAKHALDRLAALVAPRATVVREGRQREVPVSEVVVGDTVAVKPGDQVVADGPVVASQGALLDESVLSGESEPVPRGPGEEVRSGSFLVEGGLSYQVAAVGPESYAERVAGEARAFRHPRSPLERSLNHLLLWMLAAMVPLAAALGLSLTLRDASLERTVSTSTAAVVSLIPEGLILLASLAFAVGALRMSRRGALVQQLNAVESLAAADVICLDKTGTLTDPSLRVVDLVPGPGVSREDLADQLGRYASASPSRNATLTAIAAAYPDSAAPAEDVVPFSSDRRWSALHGADGWQALGAPELFELEPGLSASAGQAMSSGRRVLCLASAADGDNRGPAGPEDFQPLGLVVLSERLRPETVSTVAFLRSQGVELKVLSGDSPATVSSIAADAGLRVEAEAVDGRGLPEDSGRLAELMRSHSVVGRISPEGKRRVVEALKAEGRYVAMVGDGVNDVPALKAARLAIAQGSGVQMARSVADVVLVHGDFASVPAMVAEGRQILRNVQRVAKLFLTKSAFAAALILTVGLSDSAYPFLPRHLSLAAGLTIGIPAFVLALAPSPGRYWLSGFLRSVARFAAPSGVGAAVGVLAAYLFALHVLDASLLHARTVATTALVTFGLLLILRLERQEEGLSRAPTALLVAVMAAAYTAVLALPFARAFFELASPSALQLATGVLGGVVGIALVAGLQRVLTLRVFTHALG